MENFDKKMYLVDDFLGFDRIVDNMSKYTHLHPDENTVIKPNNNKTGYEAISIFNLPFREFYTLVTKRSGKRYILSEMVQTLEHKHQTIILTNENDERHDTIKNIAQIHFEALELVYGEYIHVFLNYCYEFPKDPVVIQIHSDWLFGSSRIEEYVLYTSLDNKRYCISISFLKKSIADGNNWGINVSKLLDLLSSPRSYYTPKLLDKYIKNHNCI